MNAELEKEILLSLQHNGSTLVDSKLIKEAYGAPKNFIEDFFMTLLNVEWKKKFNEFIKVNNLKVEYIYEKGAFLIQRVN